VIKDGAMLLGHAYGERALMARRGEEVFAVGASCTHYGAPLEQGLLVDDTVRCPWHHACFSLRSGEALRAPALNPISCWRVERRDGIAYVREKITSVRRPIGATPGLPQSILIVGGGGAGNAAAEMLRREGYTGKLTMLSADKFIPCDRPNLSKNFLAGSAPEEWIPLRSEAFYREQDIDLKLNARVESIDTAHRYVQLMDGAKYTYDALLLATGAEPVRLEIPGGDLPHVHYLRTLADSLALVEKALTSQRAVVIGASFIGLEVTASLRARDIDVHVVGREACPMERILGPDVGNFIRHLHEAHGVTFHLGMTVGSIDAQGVTLQNGERIAADFIVVGIGVRPMTLLAEQAGLAIDRGIAVDEYLQTSTPGIFAAGDIARWPDRLTGERIRVEHWVVAERQGQTAARNMLGRRERFAAVPFFWTEQYNFGLAYVGHAERWDQAELDGQLEADVRDCTITYRRGGRKLAVAVVHRDLEGLRAEVEFETRDRREVPTELPDSMIKSDKTEHVAMHKGSALRKRK
jgi:NADPH-dependent 2,4-dienoyl-CoA reductase/sulfur reductase-like enzyme/nitrite reductase/ring-hydroxylating ferredoxin subunit